MNPVFASQLTTQEAYDGKGHLIEVAAAPGALPRTAAGSAPRSQVVLPATRPAVQPASAQPATMLASVPMPEAAPLPKEGEAPREQPKSITGLLNNLFGGSKAQASAPPPTEVAVAPPAPAPAKPRHAVMRTAAAPHEAPAKPQAAPAEQPKAVAKAAPAPAAPQPAAPQAASELRTAFSGSQPSNEAVIRGAQPVLQSGSFESRWTALR